LAELVLKLSALRTATNSLVAGACDGGKHACQDACMDGFLIKRHPAKLDAMFRTLLPIDTPAEAAA
jgi:hypothetical protein